MQITTKLVRKIVRSINNDTVYGHSYTDITKKANSNLRNVSFFIDYYKAQAFATELRTILKLLGYSNVVKITTSKTNGLLRNGGYTYLRINNCILD